MRLNKALSSIASRRGAEKLVFEGRVTLNGEKVEHPAISVDPAKDVLCVDGERIRFDQRKVYFLLNKPTGYICTAREGRSRRVIDLFRHMPHRLFTVGRLDRDTTGLIVVTNDGDFADQLIHPSNNHHKEYLVKVTQELTEDHLKKMGRGIIIDGTHVKPVSVTKVRRGTLKIIVVEGKKHEVRELVKRAGLTLLELKRIRVGPFHLGALPLGGYREIAASELAKFSITN